MSECPRCKAIDDAVPLEIQLRVLATSDWSIEDLAFQPRSMTQDQAVAAEMLTAALARYWSAFGTEVTGARMGVFVQAVRVQAKNQRVSARILAARADINARARARYEVGDAEGARAIQAEPTPDYPGKAEDDAWMRAGNGA